MNTTSVYNALRTDLARTAVAVLVGWGFVLPSFATTALGDRPVFADVRVPGNVVLALSVEFPTVNRASYPDPTYSSAREYLGYFDPNKCYLYNFSATEPERHFYPQGLATNRTCVGANDNKWSGNYLNWATGQAIDSFRWTMTGGNRSTDSVAATILQKAWHSGQGNYFPDKSLPAAEIAGATPFTGTALNSQIQNRGFGMRFSVGAPAGNSFTGKYYNRSNADIITPLPSTAVPILTRNDAAIDFQWGDGSPGGGVNADNFFVVWEGTFTATEGNGNYRFRTRTDDGVRLYINDVLQIDQWIDQGPTEYTTPNISLNQGDTIKIKLEYYERAGGAVAQLQWRTPNNSSYRIFNNTATTPPGSFASAPVDYNPGVTVDAGTVYDAKIRVKVCDPSAAAGDGSTAGSGLESNCIRYGSNWKPEGLVQEYADRMRFSAFGYLNDPSMLRDGGVLRASQKFVGPTQPSPGAPAVNNLEKEWDPLTGQMVVNPNPIDATATVARYGTGVTVANSGVMNYLNKFGQLTPGNYKDFDPVSEMYYAAQRYLRGMENVPEFSNIAATASVADRQRFVDGFPVITDWTVNNSNQAYRKRSIEYSCQKNFILGIGDIYTHRDKNLPGNGRTPNARFGADEPAIPASVTDDVAVDVIAATNKVGALQGLSATLGATNSYSGRNNSAGIAGLAYWANTSDIRPDMDQTQTIQTYWVDVLEAPFEANNQFLLAAKYGGFAVPNGYSTYGRTTPLEASLWTDPGDLIGTTQRPRNYFTAGDPRQMRDGLTGAFRRIDGEIQQFTTSFSTSLPQVQTSGNASYSASFSTEGWTGELVANEVAFNLGASTSSQTERWRLSQRLQDQLSGSGWDTDRKVITRAGTTSVPFRLGSLTALQRAALDSTMRPGDDASGVLNYLRGQRAYELGSTDTTVLAADKRYRNRRDAGLLGDIVNSKPRPVAPPNFPFSDTTNPGYGAFKEAYRTRPTVVYLGANDGMLHAIDGRLDAAAGGGRELFAYVPSPTFTGPSGTPGVNGLVALADPLREHYYYVNAAPANIDIDMSRTYYGPTETRPADPAWRTLLIGGLGKGGRSYYALDVTDSNAMASETELQTANRLLWEFTDPDMGYSFGEPVVVKTRKYGWVAILTSGYNNTDGLGYFFVVNPRTGALLEKIGTGAVEITPGQLSGPTAQTGLAHANGFVNDATDGTADAVYAGDLHGNVWRLDMSSASAPFTLSPTGTGDPAPLATLRSPNNARQPITSRPLIEQPRGSNRRVITIGTGRLLDATDIDDAQAQSFYAINDGFVAQFNQSLPAGLSFPITRANLAENTDVAVGVTVAGDQMGWYLELGLGAGPRGWRVVSDQATASGLVSFASVLPGGGDACSPSGNSRIYALNLNNGISGIPAVNGVATRFIEVPGVNVDLRFLAVSPRGPDGRVSGPATLVIGYGQANGAFGFRGLPGASPDAFRRINWRELPLIN
jgi:type IV pilus assembly protein PilY1